MEPIVISATKQEFNGVNYYLCGMYFQHKGRRLHRVVWEYHNCPIPKGHCVHHKDHNRSNNSSKNLILQTISAHQSYHGKLTDHTNAVAAMQESAKKWHGSKEGREWHEQHYWKHAHEKFAKKTTKKCAFCNRQFRGLHQAKYCHANCKAANFRKLNPNYYRALPK